MDEMEVRKTLSHNLRRLRKQRGLSQLKLANELNMAMTFISDIENCKKWVSPTTLALFASFFGVSVCELFSPDESRSQQDEPGSMTVQNSLRTFSAILQKEVQNTITDVCGRFGIAPGAQAT